VVVHGWTDAPISWPVCRPLEGKGRPGILVEEELARALRGESALALWYWWGPSPSVVHCWRKALGVERFNEGSKRLQRLYSQAGADAQRGVPRRDMAERMRRAHQERDLVRHIQPCPRPGAAAGANAGRTSSICSEPGSAGLVNWRPKPACRESRRSSSHP
jgi:hypothetical protein